MLLLIYNFVYYFWFEEKRYTYCFQLGIHFQRRRSNSRIPHSIMLLTRLESDFQLQQLHVSQHVLFPGKYILRKVIVNSCVSCLQTRFVINYIQPSIQHIVIPGIYLLPYTLLCVYARVCVCVRSARVRARLCFYIVFILGCSLYVAVVSTSKGPGKTSVLPSLQVRLFSLRGHRAAYGVFTGYIYLGRLVY